MVIDIRIVLLEYYSLLDFAILDLIPPSHEAIATAKKRIIFMVYYLHYITYSYDEGRPMGPKISMQLGLHA